MSVGVMKDYQLLFHVRHLHIHTRMYVQVTNVDIHVNIHV
jgi:hypothetical protein